METLLQLAAVAKFALRDSVLHRSWKMTMARCREQDYNTACETLEGSHVKSEILQPCACHVLTMCVCCVCVVTAGYD